jgi:hypothetical protein
MDVKFETITPRHRRGAEALPAKPWVDEGPTTGPAGETPSAPVPEPGTIALASMGLMTLGASLRNRIRARGHAAEKQA